MSLSRVKKRDGREVPFEKKKIEGAVARAQVAVGESDTEFAGEVADVVEFALRRRHDASTATRAVPTIEEIQDLVEQALIELGRATVAKAYILYRDRRARLREAVQVRESAPVRAPRGPTGTRVPRVRMSSGVEPWSKGRIVAALMNEADVPRETAVEVAARVEERVFDSGLVRISTALIRELVDNELIEMGLSQALRRQRPVGLPRHDLRLILADPAEPSSAGLEQTSVASIGAEILRRYTLDDVLPEPLAEMHLRGDLWLENVDAPGIALTRGLPCELYLRGEAQPRAAFDLLGDVAAQLLDVSHGLVLEDVPALLQCLHKGARPARSTSSWLLALSALIRASGKRIDLCLASSGPLIRAASLRTQGDEAEGDAHAPAWLARLLEDLHELDAAAGPRVFIDGEDLLRLSSGPLSQRAIVDALLASGALVPAFGGEGERFVGPGLARATGERGVIACYGAVALNLPRAARRAGAWREDQLFEELAHLVEGALDIAVALQAFQRSHKRRSSARASFAIAPVGLCEALRWLADGELLPEQGGRVLAFLSEAAQRFGAARGVAVVLTPYFGARARARFAELDRELYPMVQPLLFGDAQRGARERELPYSEGFDLTTPDASSSGSFGASHGASSALAAGAALLLASQRSGALHPPSILGASALGEFAPLAAWARLERQRSRLRSGKHPLYALPPSPSPARAQDELPYRAEDADAFRPGVPDETLTRELEALLLPERS